MFGLTYEDGLVLFGVGVLFSGAIWFIIERFKRTAGLTKPKTEFERKALRWLPILVAMVLTVPVFPLILEGVRPGIVDELTTGDVWIFPRQVVFILIILIIGAVGGFGSKVAHDHAVGRVTRWLRQFSGGDDDDGTDHRAG